MRCALACAAALTAVPLAGSSALGDEAVLLQTRAHGQPEEGSFQLLCDEVQGCRYHVQTASTPAPYKLICDDAAGCRYPGATPPPARPRRPLLSVGGAKDLELVMNALGGAALKLQTPPPPKAGPLQGLDSLDLPGLLADVPGLLRGVKETFKDLPQWLQGLKLPKLPAPLGAGEPPAGAPLAHFVPDNLMCCVQGAPDYVREKLAKLKASPLGAGYASAEVAEGGCRGRGYGLGPLPEQCFPQASLWMSLQHPMDPTSEPKLMAAYAAEHGFASVGPKMREVCAP